MGGMGGGLVMTFAMPQQEVMCRRGLQFAPVSGKMKQHYQVLRTNMVKKT